MKKHEDAFESDDNQAVDAFAQRMKRKLAYEREKGRGGWRDCSVNDLSISLRDCVENGDPVDVANLCMFLWLLGKPISTVGGYVSSGKLETIIEASVMAVLAPDGVPVFEWPEQSSLNIDEVRELARQVVAVVLQDAMVGGLQTEVSYDRERQGGHDRHQRAYAKTTRHSPSESSTCYGIVDPDYARAYSIIRCLAWSYGYAVGLHGSFTRDLDLMLVPWSEPCAIKPEHMINMMAEQTGLKVHAAPPSLKPFGRQAWTLLFPEFGDPRWVDISIMPKTLPASQKPIDMVLYCPACGEQHVDGPEAEWVNPPHRSHLCRACGYIWRPADVLTNGVAAIKTRGERDSAPVAAHASVPDDWRKAVQAAYGHLWMVNTEPGTPNQYPPEKAAEEARKLLANLLTRLERENSIKSIIKWINKHE